MEIDITTGGMATGTKQSAYSTEKKNLERKLANPAIPPERKTRLNEQYERLVRLEKRSASMQG